MTFYTLFCNYVDVNICSFVTENSQICDTSGSWMLLWMSQNKKPWKIKIDLPLCQRSIDGFTLLHTQPLLADGKLNFVLKQGKTASLTLQVHGAKSVAFKPCFCTLIIKYTLEG